MRRRPAIAVGAPPKSRASPALGRVSPVSRLTAVVLPAPFGPSSAVTCPGWSDSDTSVSAATRP